MVSFQQLRQLLAVFVIFIIIPQGSKAKNGLRNSEDDKKKLAIPTNSWVISSLAGCSDFLARCVSIYIFCNTDIYWQLAVLLLVYAKWLLAVSSHLFLWVFKFENYFFLIFKEKIFVSDLKNFEGNTPIFGSKQLGLNPRWLIKLLIFLFLLNHFNLEMF